MRQFAWPMTAITVLFLLWAPASADDQPQLLSLDRWQRHVIDSKKPWKAIFIAGADIDSDGLQDIITGGWWYRNPGEPAGNWQRIELGKPLKNMAAVYDFDGDADVLGTCGKGAEANSIFVWAENDGHGSFRIHDNIAPAEGDFLQGIAIDRLDESHFISVALSWHQGGNGVQMLTVPRKPAAEQWTWQKIAEVSQDEQISFGQIDGRTPHDLLLGTKWLRNSPNGWTVHSITKPTGRPDRNRLADMNNDGKLDAVVGYEAISVSGKLVWYEQQAYPTVLWKEPLIAEPVGPMSLSVADLDRDGDLDVVVGEHNLKNPETEKLIVFENVDGQATEWKSHVIHTGDEHHDGAILVDIDQDGDLDVISLGWSHSNVLLYENRAIRSN